MRPRGRAGHRSRSKQRIHIQRGCGREGGKEVSCVEGSGERGADSGVCAVPQREKLWGPCAIFRGLTVDCRQGVSSLVTVGKQRQGRSLKVHCISRQIAEPK